MSRCSSCGTLYNQTEAAAYFHKAIPLLRYDKFAKPLCGKCAVMSVDVPYNDYYDWCENCGKSFNLGDEMSGFAASLFQLQKPEVNMIDNWDIKILCCECTLEKMQPEKIAPFDLGSL